MIRVLLATPARFTDTETAGIDFQHVSGKSAFKRVVETMGPGAAFLDYDSNGFLDLYLVNGGKFPMTYYTNRHNDQRLTTNVLYRNDGDGTFSDATRSSGVGYHGYGMGVGVGDINNDGFVDLYITNFAPNVLYQNNGDGTFSDITKTAGVGNETHGR